MTASNDNANGRPPGPQRPQAKPPGSGDAFSFSSPVDMQQILHVLTIIKERWLWGVAFGVLAGGIFAFVELRKEPLYAADAYLLIETESERVIDVEKVVDTNLSGLVEAELNNHLKKLGSRKFRQAVADSFGAAEAQLITKPYAVEGTPPPVAAVLAETVQVIRDGMVFPVVARHRDPRAAALIANRYVAQYISSNIARSWTGNESARTFLEQQSLDLRGQIEAAEKELTDYRTRHNLVSLEETQNIIVERLKSINAQRTATRIEQVQLEASVDQVEDALEAEADITEIPFIASYGAISGILANKKTLESELAALELRYLERHPKIIEATERLQQVNGQLDREVARAVRDLRNKKESADRRMDHLGNELQAAEAEALALDRQAVEYNVLKRQLESERRTFDTIISRLNETNLSAELDTTNLRILDEAMVPGRPFSPNPPKVFGIAAFLFAVCLVGIPLVVEGVDNRVKSGYDVESFIGKPLLADLPYVKALASQELSPTAVLSDNEEMLSEGFRAAYSSLQLHSKADMPKTMLITSTRPSEGKTFVASNLGACMALHGLRTLLIDTDFRRPTLHRHFELRNDKGILPYIKEGALPGDSASILDDPWLSIQKITENLDFLRAGGSTKKTTELIDSRAFEDLMRRLRGHYDVLLLDTPPISVFTDSFFLAEFADEIIYVARYNAVSRHKVRHFISKLDKHQERVVGMVINGRTSAKGQRYGYDYAYSYYSSDYKYYKKYAREKDRESGPPAPQRPRSRRSVSS